MSDWIKKIPTRHDLSQYNGNLVDDPGGQKQQGQRTTTDNVGSSKGVVDVDLTLSLNKPGDQSFPMVKHGQGSEVRSLLKNEGEARVHNNMASALNAQNARREPHFKSEDVFGSSKEQVKYHMFFGENSYSCLKAEEKVTGSASSAHQLDSRSACRQEDVNWIRHILTSRTNLTSMETEHSNPPYLRQKNPALLRVGPSTSGNHMPTYLQEHFQRMQNRLELSRPRIVHYEERPHFLHNVETMRICTPMDSAEALVDGHRFSAKHSFFITKHTDVSVYPGSGIFRGSRLSSTQPKEHTFAERLHSPQHFAQSPQGVKLVLLSSSSDSDVQKKEISEHTDAMDMDLCLTSSASNKENVYKSSSCSLRPTMAIEKDRPRKQKSKVPNLNLELHTVPASSSSMEDAEQSPSRTHMETLPDVDHQKSNDDPGNHQEAEPGIRWIKRLKLFASSPHALGTKYMDLGEASCHGKLNKSPSKTLEGNSSNSHDKEEALAAKCILEDLVPLNGRRPGKEPAVPEPEITLSKKSETSSEGTKKGGQEPPLSLYWIRRWSKLEGSKRSVAPVQTCEGQLSRLTVEESEKKRFPSIGAMALMGRAMNGFPPCEYRHKKACVVWNTKSLG